MFYLIFFFFISTLLSAQESCSSAESISADQYQKKAEIFGKKNQLDSLFFYAQKARKQYEDIQCWEEVNHMNYYLCLGELRQGKQEACLDCLVSAMKYAKEKNYALHSFWYARLNFIHAKLLFSAKDYQAALDAYQNSYLIFKKLNKNDRVLESLRGMARIEYFRQDFALMETHLDEAYSLVEDKKTLQPILQLYGALYYRTGDYQKGLQKYMDGLDIVLDDIQNRLDSTQLASYYNNIGLLHMELGDIYLAEKYCKNSLHLSTQLKDNFKVATISQNLSGFFNDKRQYNKAMDYALKGLFALNEAKGPSVQEMDRSYISMYNTIGDIHYKKQEYDLAEEYLAKSLEIQKKEPFMIDESLRLLGLCFKEKEDFRQALIYFDKALKNSIQTYGKQHPICAKLLYDLAETNTAQDQHATALEQIEQAQKALLINNGENRIITDQKLYINLLQLSAKIKRQQGKSQEAYTLILQAENYLDDTRQSFKEEESKLFWLQSMLSTYETVIELSLELYQNKPDAQYLEHAFHAFERCKSSLLADALQLDKARKLSNIPQDLILQEKHLSKEIFDLEQQLIVSKRKGATKKLQSLEEQLLQAKRNSIKLQEKLENEYSDYFALKYGREKIQISDVQQRLKQNQLFLEFFIGLKKDYLFAISKDQVRLIPLKNIHRLVHRLRNSITDLEDLNDSPAKALKRYKNSAYPLYQQTLEPLVKGKAYSQIFIVPDGPFNFIPFEALLESQTEEENYAKLPYLINKYSFNYHYSASMLFNKEYTKNTSTDILAMSSSYHPEDIKNLSINSRMYKLRQTLKNIPGTTEEVKNLEQSYHGEFIKENAGTEAALKAKLNAKSYSIVHLAMHGIVDPQSARHSGLLLSMDSLSQEDNLLHAYELKSMNINTNLLVLSACETGYGKYKRGEGVVSLGRNFIYAGVPSIIMTLWPINDKTSQVLVAKFYGELAKGQDIDRALQKAKIDYIHAQNGLAAHPFFWAGFVHLGDRNAIEIVSKQGYSLYLVLAGIFTLIGFIIWRRRTTKSANH